MEVAVLALCFWQKGQPLFFQVDEGFCACWNHSCTQVVINGEQFAHSSVEGVLDLVAR